MSKKSSASSGDDGGRSSTKKKGGGFLARQAKAKKTVTEEELLKKGSITPEDVLKLAKSTESKCRSTISNWINFCFCSERLNRTGSCKRKQHKKVILDIYFFVF